MSVLNGLPLEIRNKINKTKQTRGAQPADRVPYQNRVNRNGIAIIPYDFRHQLHPDFSAVEGSYRIMVKPNQYFSRRNTRNRQFDQNVVIGVNAFVFYNNRADWEHFPILNGWVPCNDRSGSGHYIARIPGTTALENGDKIVEGEPQGIRFFEYASTKDIDDSIAQLAWLAWMTEGIDQVRTDGNTGVPQVLRNYLRINNLDNIETFVREGAVKLNTRTNSYYAICPLCRKAINAIGLMTRVEQVEGREVVDLTITEVNLFHLRDLRPGQYNHKPYLLTWGHHYCNLVAKDAGINETVNWMKEVLINHGYQIAAE